MKLNFLKIIIHYNQIHKDLYSQHRLFSKFDKAMKTSECSNSIIGYVSDIEGNIDYWNKYLEISKVLYRDPNDKSICLYDKSCYFVYGGDVCDRGPGDVQLLHELIFLKEKYPEQVYLIIGNRDINKLRMHPAVHSSVLKTLPYVYWLRKHKTSDYIPANYILNNIESKIKWMLKYSMGSPDAYELRSEEIRRLYTNNSINHTTTTTAAMNNNNNNNNISEIISPLYPAVAAVDLSTSLSPSTYMQIGDKICEKREEYLSDSTTTTETCRPGEHPELGFLAITDPQSGILTRYLELGQISLILGDVMFVHGALQEHNMGWIPPFVKNLTGSSLDSGRTVFTKVKQGITSATTKVNEVQLASTTTSKVNEVQLASTTTTSSTFTGGTMVSDPIEWTKAMNAFATSEISDYRLRLNEFLYSLSSTTTTSSSSMLEKNNNTNSNTDNTLIWDSTGQYSHPQPGSRLIQYGMGWLPHGIRNPSVIYASYLTNSSPNIRSDSQEIEQIQKWLAKGGITRLCVGHQPNGDAPLIFKSKEFQIICADNSYSKNVYWPKQQLLALSIARSSDLHHLSLLHNKLDPCKEEIAHIEWTTYDTFCTNTTNTCATNNSISTANTCTVVIDDVNVHSNEERRSVRNIVSISNTRSKHSVTEVLFTHSSPLYSNNIPGNSTITTTSTISSSMPTSPSKVDIVGTLSCNLGFHFQLDTLPWSISQYIGRMTTAGWVVKGYGIVHHIESDTTNTTSNDLPFIIPITDNYNNETTVTKESFTVALMNTTSSDTSNCNDIYNSSDIYNNYYLLSHSETGHVFRNRLVHREDIHKEDFSSLHSSNNHKNNDNYNNNPVMR